jgi:hypothetical protein
MSTNSVLTCSESSSGPFQKGSAAFVDFAGYPELRSQKVIVVPARTVLPNIIEVLVIPGFFELDPLRLGRQRQTTL